MPQGHSLMLHMLTSLISAYLFVIFLWWWIKQKKATTIYGFTCLLMLGIASSHGGAWFLYDHYSHGNNISDLIDCWWWPLRQYPTLIALSMYAIYVTAKACFGWRPNQHQRRRETDL